MAKHHHPKRIVCCEPGCDKPRFCYGRCPAHFHSLDPALFERLKGMTRKDRAAEFERTTTQPELPRWEWAGHEDELAAMVEQQEREKVEEQKQ